jgi:cytochrome P450/NADPH-cytochrome P450 reductase
MSASKEIPIPGPRGVPILGNIYDIEPEVPLNSIDLLADNYGESMILLAIMKSYHLLTTGQARSFVSPPLAVPASS